MGDTISLTALRRHVINAQGYTGRGRRGRPAEVAETIRRLGAVQLDSISTVGRSHRLTLGSRVGAYPPGTVTRLLAGGVVFEYWAHEACLVPVEDWPVWRRRMSGRHLHHWYGPIIDSDPALARRVLDEIRERGPLGSRDFEGSGGGGMWNWKPAKRMLEALWTAGHLVIGGRQGFQRLYDLPERVIPQALLDAPEPSEQEFLRAVALRAVRGRGALTVSGMVEHNRLRGGVARLRPHVTALVNAGEVRELAVEDGGPPVYVAGGTDLDDNRPSAAVLISPFDNLLWDRPFAARVLGFDHLIEVYKRPHERRYGYYVLPFVLGDRLAARVDLKTDRAAGCLRLLALHPEPRIRWGVTHERALDGALTRLAAVVGASTIVR
jgi:uncharacterized protein